MSQNENVGMQRFQILLFVFAVLMVAVFGGVLWIARGISRRTQNLASTAERIAAGDLALSATVGNQVGIGSAE